jgi:hypothetical protein
MAVSHAVHRSTKGEKKYIGPVDKGAEVNFCTADRTPREMLDKRLEKTPSNARCFAKGSSFMC